MSRRAPISATSIRPTASFMSSGGSATSAVPHPTGKISPADDIRVMEEELVLSDLVMVSARIEKLEKDLKKMKDPEGEKERDLLERLTPFSARGGPPRLSTLPRRGEVPAKLRLPQPETSPSHNQPGRD